MNFQTPTQELLGRLAAEGISQKRIADVLSVAPSAITALYKGGRALKHDEAVRLMGAFPSVRTMPTHDLPIIGVAGAGNWEEAIALPEDTIQVPHQIGQGGRFVVRVRGESMNRLLQDGAFAVVDPDDRTLYAGCLYLLQNGDAEGTIKRFRNDPACFEPVSSDPSFKPIMVGSMEFHVIGRITGSMQKF